MDDHQREKHVLSQLVKAQDAIRHKYNLLKHTRDYTDKVLNKTFKPIVDPLKTIVSEVEPIKSLVEPLKNLVKKNPPEVVSVKKPKFIKKRLRHEINIAAAAANSSDKYETTQSSGEDTDATITHNTTQIYNSLSEPSEDESLAADKYMNALDKNDSNFLDLIYGVRKEPSGAYTLGNSKVIFDKNNVDVDGFKYPKTHGLMELLVAKQPNQTMISQDDLKIYKEILEMSSIHRKKMNPNESIRAHNSSKFNNIIAPLFSLTKKPIIGGRGLQAHTSLPIYKVARNNINMDYVYWDDPNELVDRLQLLVAEQSAGNNNHINEIHSIIEELREGGYIY